MTYKIKMLPAGLKENMKALDKEKISSIIQTKQIILPGNMKSFWKVVKSGI
jgi:hypothetical protein